MSRQNSRDISNINVTLNGHEIGINRTPNENAPFSDVKVLCLRGANGNGIASITKTSSSGNVDTYTITYDDGDTDTFTITNGVIAVDAALSPTSENAIQNKAVDAAFKALDGSISGTPGTGKTLSAFSQTDGNIAATFSNIAITKSQVTDFPESMPANGGTAAQVGHNLNLSVFTEANGSPVAEAFNGSSAMSVDFLSMHVRIYSTDWSANPDSDGYYTNEVDFGEYAERPIGFTTYWRPLVSIAPSVWDSDTDPTAAEVAAFRCVNQFKFSTGTNETSMTLRAKTKPTSTFYVIVQGLRLR